MERTDNQLAHKLALKHRVLTREPLSSSRASSHTWVVTRSAEIPAQWLPSKAHRCWSSGLRRGSVRSVGGGPCERWEGAGGAVPQGLKGCSSGATERCVPRVWNLGKIFNNGTIVDDGEEVN